MPASNENTIPHGLKYTGFFGTFDLDRIVSEVQSFAANTKEHFSVTGGTRIRFWCEMSTDDATIKPDGYYEPALQSFLLDLRARKWKRAKINIEHGIQTVSGLELMGAYREEFFQISIDREERRCEIQCRLRERPLTEAFVNQLIQNLGLSSEPKSVARDIPKPRSPVGDSTERTDVFTSYSHKDNKRWHEELKKHLKPYVRVGSIRAWLDEQIQPGSKWFAEIQRALSRTKVAVLLVTPDFIDSDFIHEHEVTPLLKAAEDEGVYILWIPVYGSAYMVTPLKDYQALSDPTKPLAEMKAERQKAWVDICQKINQIANLR